MNTEAFRIDTCSRDYDPVVATLMDEGYRNDGTVIETHVNDGGFTIGWTWHVPVEVVERVRRELVSA